MTRRAFVPDELSHGPFTLAQAREAGIDLWHLRRRRTWRRIGPEVYVWARLTDAPVMKLHAAALRAPGGAFSGLTAAWLHGLPVSPPESVEVTLRPGAVIAGRAAMRIRRAELRTGDVTSAKGFRATSIERTLADLSASQPLTEVVVLADAATHTDLTTCARLHAAAVAASGRPGVAAFRQAIDLIEPATESPMESRVRMRFVFAGLPRPVVQQEIRDEHGEELLARLDLYYPEARLGIEYDGATHKTSLVEDNRRQNRLTRVGVRLLRFTAADVYDRPEAMVAEVRAMLNNPLPEPVPLERASGVRLPEAG